MSKQIKKIQKNLTTAEDWKKKWHNGAELIRRVTARLQQTEAALETMNARIRSSNAVVGALIADRNDLAKKNEVIVTKSMIKEILEKYQVTATETEDKLGYLIKVEEVKADDSKETRSESESGDVSSNERKEES